MINHQQLAILVRLNELGAKVQLTVIRAGKSRKIQATLGEHEVVDVEWREIWRARGVEGGKPWNMRITPGAVKILPKGEDGCPSQTHDFIAIKDLLDKDLLDNISQPAGYMTMAMVDDDGRTFILNQLCKDQVYLVVTSKDGKTLYSGPVTRDKQGRIMPNDKMPKDVQESLKKISRVLGTMKIDLSNTTIKWQSRDLAVDVKTAPASSDKDKPSTAPETPPRHKKKR